MSRTKKRMRRPSSPKGEYTPPCYMKKRIQRAINKERAAGGMVNTANGQWVERDSSVSNKSLECSIQGSKLRGGSTKGGPKPHFEYYNAKFHD